MKGSKSPFFLNFIFMATETLLSNIFNTLNVMGKNIASIVTNGISVTFSGGGQTVTSTTATDSTGSPLAAGATEISFTTNSSFVGTINGIARNASTVYVIDSATGKTLPSIAYTVTGGSMIIDKTV